MNTNAAFVAAGNRSYYGIETDIHVTGDEKIVVFHDDNTRKCTGIDMMVEQSTLAELQAHRLYDMEAGRYRTDLHMPTLDEYIRICKKYEKKAVLELKNDMAKQHIQLVIDIIKELDYLEHIVFISFSWDNCVTIRRLLPEQPIQWLTEKWAEVNLADLANYQFGLDIIHKELTEERMRQAHACGIPVNAWTVNEKERAEELISWGIDFITTDILE